MEKQLQLKCVGSDITWFHVCQALFLWQNVCYSVYSVFGKLEVSGIFFQSIPDHRLGEKISSYMCTFKMFLQQNVPEITIECHLEKIRLC